MLLVARAHILYSSLAERVNRAWLPKGIPNKHLGVIHMMAIKIIFAVAFVKFACSRLLPILPLLFTVTNGRV